MYVETTESDSGRWVTGSDIRYQPWESASVPAAVLARSTVVSAPSDRAARPTVEITRQASGVSVALPSVPDLANLRKSLKAVVEILSLKPGWNSYSAKPIEPGNAVRAIELLAAFVGPDIPAPTLVPTVRGGIQLEWHNQRGNIEIYIESPSDVRFFAESVQSGDEAEKPIDGNEQELGSWIARLYER